MSYRGRSGPDWRGPELFGLLLIVVGAYWLLASSGLFTFLEWQFVWPVAIIALGLFLLVARVRPGGHDQAAVEREGASRLDLQIAMGGGRLWFGGGSSHLLEWTARGGGVRAVVRRDGDRALVRLRSDMPGYGWLRGPVDWRVATAGDVPVDLHLTCGAGEFELDLSGVRLVGGRLSIGAAHTRLVLPRPSGEVPIAVSTGAASLVVEVPPGVETRVLTSGGLISLDGPSETPGYADARDRVTVSVAGGASSVSVR